MGIIKHSKPTNNLSNKPIPARIVIGVTGHLKLVNVPELINAIHAATEEIKQMVPPSSDTPLHLTVLSPLAEGADRLAVCEILKIPGAILAVVLPLAKADYIQDFDTVESKAEFEAFISQAVSVKVLPPANSRVEAYEQVGYYVVEHCNVLSALWNGRSSSSKGGTQEIVQYARYTKCPLVWINNEKPKQITLELGHNLSERSFLDRH